MEDEGLIDLAASAVNKPHDDDDDDDPAIHQAALSGLKKDPVVNVANDEGANPLHMAAQLGNVDVVKSLVLDKFANPNKTVGIGATSLFTAAVHRQKGVVWFLVTETTADVNLANGQTTTPLWVAVNRAWH